MCCAFAFLVYFKRARVHARVSMTNEATTRPSLSGRRGIEPRVEKTDNGYYQSCPGVRCIVSPLLVVLLFLCHYCAVRMRKLACTFMERVYEFMWNGIHFTEPKPQYAHDTIRCMCNNCMSVCLICCCKVGGLYASRMTQTHSACIHLMRNDARARASMLAFSYATVSDDAQIDTAF